MEEPRNEPISTQPHFTITDYSEGYYEPNGDIVECPFSKDQLEDWNHMNEFSDGKLIGKGQKLSLPTNSEPGYKIIFGRNKDQCNVVIDTDLVGDYTQRETAISRRHFEIQLNKDGRWEISDTGSTNGVDCDRPGDSEHKAVNLKDTNEPWVLQDGDLVFVGGGPGQSGRIIGFRFYETGSEGSYLVKFNATSLDELASGAGLYEKHPDLIGKLSETPLNKESTKILEESGNELITILLELKNLQDKDFKMEEYLGKALEFQRKILSMATELAGSYYQGDWVVAAGELGEWAYKKGDKLLKDRGDDITEDELKQAKAALEIASQLMELFSKYNFKGYDSVRK